MGAVNLPITSRLETNIIIAAKTTEPHPKLPGTIYTAAEEIEKAGGKALPFAVDIRDENQIAAAVAKAVETFGGIDILVNNASAISLTGTLETPMKRYDLMHGINTRGTFACSQACIPYLWAGDASTCTCPMGFPMKVGYGVSMPAGRS